MIVDKKGDLFEDRRKARTDRRKDTENGTGGKRKENRRKENNKQIKK